VALALIRQALKGLGRVIMGQVVVAGAIMVRDV
jgi:hypothetical protein